MQIRHSTRRITAYGTRMHMRSTGLPVPAAAAARFPTRPLRIWS
nr:MAG TPA: hypothetical protein [Caudoviricetes sp.]